MKTPLRLLVGVSLATASVAVPVSAVAAGCDPVQTPATYRGQVPAPRDVLGIDLGEREVTAAESDRYLDAVAAASDRVVAGTLATTAQGRPVRYAIVGRPERVTPVGLALVRASAQLLRDPRTPSLVAGLVAAQAPAILWVTGNVHGGEESGTDAALRTLRDLADRSDCAARRILDNAVVVVVPTQNPDGREADTRQNAYGFDMNRDWFARTQPETDGKLALLNQYPPVLYIDAHEMGGVNNYFFPPNSDPIYHEISETSVDWIDNVYGAAMAAEFARQGIPFFNQDIYDLFYMGYGDSVPTTGFLGAGMTYEKSGNDPIAVRMGQQYLTQWVSLSAAASARASILRGWHSAYVEAYRQGVAGELEPNKIYNPGKDLTSQVPDRAVRHYFLRADDPSKAREVALVVSRLQRMGVEVHRLVRPLRVPDFRAYGRSPAAVTLPAGTYWISLAQGQKHWVQAMLNEDTYVPFPYFFDVTAWSLPLLANVSGGSSGAVLRPAAVRAGPVSVPPVPVPGRVPSIGVLQLGTTGSALESAGWLRNQLDRVWHLPFRLLRPADVAGGLAGLDVLLVPNGSAAAAFTALGPAGQAALTSWVRAGGRYVGWRGGAALAGRLGVTSATMTASTASVPGTLFRVRVDGRSPLAAGVGQTAWQFYTSDPAAGDGLLLRSPAAVVSYPPADSADWFVSGFADGAEQLAGTAAVVDELVGAGRTVLFAGEPNFRAFTDGTAKLLLNAIVGPNPSPAARAAVAEPVITALPDPRPVISVVVRPADVPATESVLRDLGATWTTTSVAGGVLIAIDNPAGLEPDEHPWARQLPTKLAAVGVTPTYLAMTTTS